MGAQKSDRTLRPADDHGGVMLHDLWLLVDRLHAALRSRSAVVAENLLLRH